MSKCVLILMCCVLLTAVDSFASDSNDSYLRTSIGIGLPFGGTIGLNNELVLNEYFSVQLGVGYTDHINMGVVGGVSAYPIKNNQYLFNPRLTALYGKVGRVHNSDDSYKRGNGYALGGGVEYPFAASKKWRTGLDLFYATITDPIKSNGDVVVSFGVGYSFK
ncbi:MAG TPA: hypothetical protein VN642_17125 [Dongiaceae bacterium]|nr:hypothetical protein [Dongiaceae bacterium]